MPYQLVRQHDELLGGLLRTADPLLKYHSLVHFAGHKFKDLGNLLGLWQVPNQHHGLPQLVNSSGP